MSLLGYLLLLTAALCCTAAPAASDDLNSCKKPDRRVEAELEGNWEAESYPENTLASFLCRPGYTRLGSIRMICKSGKWEAQTKGQCKKKSCGHPGDIPFGSFQLSKEESFIFGAVVEYFCDDGYQMVSKETKRQCTASGWSNYPPHCEVRNCPPVDTEDNINVISTSYDEEYSVGQVIRFECKDPKLKLDGPSEIFCTSDGTWNLDKPTCVAISCKVPVIDHGSVQNSRKQFYSNNEVMQYACDRGYQATKNGQSTCTKDDWIPKPSCEEILCSLYDPVINGKLVGPNTQYRFGDKIDVQCEEGYVLQIQPNSRRECTANGWSPSTHCVSKKCDRPDIKHGIIDRDYDYYFPRDVGRYLDYYCERNYQPRAWTRISCTKAGWEPEPKCSRECSYRDALVENAQLTGTYKSVYVEGETVRFRCTGNYQTPDGKNYGERTCLPNGKFTPAKCFVTCTAPQLPNGKINQIKNEYEIGEFLLYECDRGYMTESRHLSGKSQCLAGRWPEAPHCIPISCEYNSELFNDGDIIKYRCPSGQKPRSDIGQCYFYGWGPPLVCQGIGEQCGPPPTVQYGDTVEIRKAVYRSGERVEFRCPEYYILDGNRFVTCLNGVWNEAPVCKEPCTAKERDMESNNIQLRWRSARKLYSRHGESIEFDCKPGYEALPETQMRITCDKGNLEHPKCFKRGFCVLQQSTMIANNIHYNLSTVLDHGQRIQFQCNDGMMAENKLEAKCEWRKINYPRCTAAKSCETPEILNGFVKTEQTSYDSGSNVEFDCNEGYVIDVAKKVKCENGQWIQLPVCYRPCKISPEELTTHNIELLSSNGQKNIPDKNYKHGTQISVACKSGFRRPTNAALMLECYDGKFRYPRCFSGSTCRILQDDLDANNLELDEVHDNEVFYAEGDIIHYKCKNGFYYPGQPSGKCSEQKMIYPKCTEESSV